MLDFFFLEYLMHHVYLIKPTSTPLLKAVVEDFVKYIESADTRKSCASAKIRFQMMKLKNG